MTGVQTCALPISRIKLEMPTHYCVARGEGNSVEANEATEFNNFSAAISNI